MSVGYSFVGDLKTIPVLRYSISFSEDGSFRVYLNPSDDNLETQSVQYLNLVDLN